MVAGAILESSGKYLARDGRRGIGTARPALLPLGLAYLDDKGVCTPKLG